VGFYGVDPAAGSRQFPEALRLIKQGLTNEELTFDGEFYRFRKVPIVLRPLQRPWPPLWYGVVALENVRWAALEEAHMVTLVPTDPARTLIERYAAEWTTLGKATSDLPLRGVMRLTVVAETEREAFGTAERAYRSWLGHMRFLWDKYQMEFPLPLPPEIGPWCEAGGAFVGTPASFRQFVSSQVIAIGANYLACDLAFGDITFSEALRTARLIGEEIIPAFA
jgi:alkanesulfonate monooxygenase SsuD/methylene tetrahydromethanopterin reductase-like flavin-dependent oxidoreductase (luciferase family)